MGDIAFTTFLYALCYYPLFNHWQVLDGYLNRFGAEGLGGMILIMLNIATISAANMALKGMEEDLQTALSNYISCIFIFGA